MPPSGLDIWILAGQSNMQGRGWLLNMPKPDERVWNFTSAGRWEVACEPLHRLWESYLPAHLIYLRQGLTPEQLEQGDAVHAEWERLNGVQGGGLGLSFGKALADSTGRPVGLIPCAHGGSSLEQWDFHRKAEGGASLYGAMLQRVNDALQGGTLRGLLWYQGETDASENDAPSYLERFSEWIAALRADLHHPELPVIACQIGREVIMPGDSGYYRKPIPWGLVRQAIFDLPQRVPHTAITTSIDLGLADVIHIDTPGLIRLGRRMARLALGAGSPRVEEIRKEIAPNGLGIMRLLCKGVTGGWRPRQHIGGFSTHTSEGAIHPRVTVLNAEADPADPRNIRLLLNDPLTADDTVCLGYGVGKSPYCNATDEADMPLPAFLPVELKSRTQPAVRSWEK